MIWLVLIGLFSYSEVLSTDLVAHAKIRWSKMDSGERIVVEIDGGNANRVNPNWSPAPQRLAYDLGKERELERVLKWAKLPDPHKSPSTSAKDRTLEILVENKQGKGYHSVGYWSMSTKAWQKGRFGSIYDALEPLLDVNPDTFDNSQKVNREEGGFVPQ